MPTDPPSHYELAERLAALDAELFAIPGVTGVGVGGDVDRGVIQVYVSAATPARSREQVDRLLSDTPYVVVEMSEPTAHDDPGGSHEQPE